jgi:hypothetical protein
MWPAGSIVPLSIRVPVFGAKVAARWRRVRTASAGGSQVPATGLEGPVKTVSGLAQAERVRRAGQKSVPFLFFFTCPGAPTFCIGLSTMAVCAQATASVSGVCLG